MLSTTCMLSQPVRSFKLVVFSFDAAVDQPAINAALRGIIDEPNWDSDLGVY